jgi:hypothetical protein
MKVCDLLYGKEVSSFRYSSGICSPSCVAASGLSGTLSHSTARHQQTGTLAASFELTDNSLQPLQISEPGFAQRPAVLAHERVMMLMTLCVARFK